MHPKKFVVKTAFTLDKLYGRGEEFNPTPLQEVELLALDCLEEKEVIPNKSPKRTLVPNDSILPVND